MDQQSKGIVLYHGCDKIFEKAELTRGRKNTDFGKGFYCTEDYDMAGRWAAEMDLNQNVQTIFFDNFDSLLVYTFDLNQEWLDFVLTNRTLGMMDPFYKKFDILIGPTADDRQYNTINLYEDGFLTGEEAIEILNCANFSYQTVLKTQKAIDTYKFVKRDIFTETDIRFYRKQAKALRIEANQSLKEIRKRQIQKNINDKGGR